MFLQKARKAIMAEKPKLHYPNGRGRMETVRWVLAAAGVEVPARCYFPDLLYNFETVEENVNGGALI